MADHPTLAHRAESLRPKLVRGELVLSVSEWQTIIEALDLVSGEAAGTREADISALLNRCRK